MGAPSPPDPKETAKAQGAIDRKTAITQYELNATNQKTPSGSLTYNQNGYWTPNGYLDADAAKTQLAGGKVPGNWTPSFTATQTLSKPLKQTTGNLTHAARNLSANLEQATGKPLNYSDIENNLVSLGKQRLDPQFAQQRASLESSLVARGVRPGTEAYDHAVSEFGQNQNDAYNSLYLNGQGQAIQEATALRSQPINEISALLGGTQVATPQFTQTPQTALPRVDYTGLVNQQYQAKLQSQQGMLSGLGSIIGTIGGWKFSDRRLKRNVRQVGTKFGLPWYAFEYRNGTPDEGVMADEAALVCPEAVRSMGGTLMVNYEMLEAA